MFRPTRRGAVVWSGRVLDVAVDARVGSPTFGHYVAIEINDENHRQLWVPPGFAHGFAVLSESTDFFYKCDSFSGRARKSSCGGTTPSIGMNWGIESPVLSARDAAAPLLANVEGLPIYDSV
jgi:dTDP-4-dehydrorhamnose 3,5-epimerase